LISGADEESARRRSLIDVASKFGKRRSNRTRNDAMSKDAPLDIESKRKRWPTQVVSDAKRRRAEGAAFPACHTTLHVIGDSGAGNRFLPLNFIPIKENQAIGQVLNSGRSIGQKLRDDNVVGRPVG